MEFQHIKVGSIPTPQRYGTLTHKAHITIHIESQMYPPKTLCDTQDCVHTYVALSILCQHHFGHILQACVHVPSIYIGSRGRLEASSDYRKLHSLKSAIIAEHFPHYASIILGIIGKPSPVHIPSIIKGT